MKWEMLWKMIEKRNDASVTVEIKELIQGLLNPNPLKRWSLLQIRESQFMK
jgi:hypothetical protein